MRLQAELHQSEQTAVILQLMLRYQPQNKESEHRDQVILQQLTLFPTVG